VQKYVLNDNNTINEMVKDAECIKKELEEIKTKQNAFE
jgi:hypothetical protein